MKKLDDGGLRTGDIILTSGSNKMSKAVRRATNSAISHAMIYVQHSSVIDATAEGVHSVSYTHLDVYKRQMHPRPMRRGVRGGR